MREDREDNRGGEAEAVRRTEMRGTEGQKDRRSARHKSEGRRETYVRARAEEQSWHELVQDTDAIDGKAQMRESKHEGRRESRCDGNCEG